MTEQTFNPDQWKAEGECCWCRRRTYCKKACKKRIEAGNRKLATKIVAEFTRGAKR